MEQILLPKECWMNSPLSIARHYGRIIINGNDYVAVNTYGHAVVPCSVPNEETIDLVRTDFQSFYRKLGRKKFLELLLKYERLESKALKKVFKEASVFYKPSLNVDKSSEPLNLFPDDNL